MQRVRREQLQASSHYWRAPEKNREPERLPTNLKLQRGSIPLPALEVAMEEVIQLDWSQVCDGWKDELERLWSQGKQEAFWRMIEWLIRTQEPPKK